MRAELEEMNELEESTGTTGPIRRIKDKNAADARSNSSIDKGGRVRISPTAVNAFEYVYAIERKPNEALIRVLSQAFGETFARVKVWFQNRRGRDRTGSSEDGSAQRRPTNLPPAVLQTLLGQQRAQNPNSPAPELQQSLAASTGSSDLASTTAQALNAMLTVNSISKFWGHHNHLLASELITREGERLALTSLAEDERIAKCPVAAALLERVLELRQGVIDQFVMTDGLIRETISNEPGQPPMDNSVPLLQPHPQLFGSATPGLPEVTWESLGYMPFPSHQNALQVPQHQAHHHGQQFPYGDLNQMGGQQHWEFINEDSSQFNRMAAHQAAHHIQMLRRNTPSPVPQPMYPMVPQPHIPPQQPVPMIPQIAQIAQAPLQRSRSPTLSAVDMFLSAETEEAPAQRIPLAVWILEGLLKSLRTVVAGWQRYGPEELLEALTTAQMGPPDFHRLCSYLSYHDETMNPAITQSDRIKVRSAPTQQGYASWYLTGADFIKSVPEPLAEIFGDLSTTDMPKNRRVQLETVYLVYDLKLHIITVRALLTIPTAHQN